jgi:hypothetical protein
VLARDQEHVAVEERAVVKERQTQLVGVDDLRKHLAADDRAEGAGCARLGQGFVGCGVSV